MRDFKKRRTVGAELLRVSIGVAGVLLLAGAAFGVSRSAWGVWAKFTEAAAARASAEGRLRELESRHQNIAAEVEAFSTERGVEAAIRERYGVARPGEGEIAIVREASTSDTLVQGKDILEKLWDLLFVW